ncbi:uncharacterized protein LOC111648952 [Seriola lalandi dorsalis]|uniref:uncharacterized protein LOC111648952 n=1 Tax=Seriola lalandi dorsalis TaxID=1841481 RepID=UPI000C6FA9C7|nr:uncharacterized protein LOC111648952 [Seriola lalandi dorsalis]
MFNCVTDYFNYFLFHVSLRVQPAARTDGTDVITPKTEGRPPTGRMTTTTSECATETGVIQWTSSEVNIPVTPDEMSQQELEHVQPLDHQKSVDVILKYHTACMEDCRDQIKKIFENTSDGTKQQKEEVLAVLDNAQDSFSSYLLDNTIQKHCNPIKPKKIIISRQLHRDKKRQLGFCVIKRRFLYISLIKSLAQLLSNSTVFDRIITTPQRCRKDDFLCDIMDGSLFKSHPLFSKKPSALQLILYADEIDISNPVGSHSTENKLLIFYYTLGNIDPTFRSKPAAIGPLAIANVNDIDKCGFNVILQEICKDLKLLYNGVKIQTHNGEIDLFGAVVSVCSYTLGQHELTGFKEGVDFACKHCECSLEEMQNNFEEQSFTKRTMEKYKPQCDKLKRAVTHLLKSALKPNNIKNRKSKLVDFPSFDIIQQTPRDIKNVILERVAPMEIKCVLKHLVISGQMNLEQFNSDIQKLCFSPTEIRDKPGHISVSTLASNDDKLKQSSGQMLMLLQIMPFLLNCLEKNTYIQFVLDLRDIVQTLFAPVLSVQTVSTLKGMIEKHLKKFKQLFPNNNVTPEQHYMLHLPAQILSLGPLGHMSMRFESKHLEHLSSILNLKDVSNLYVNHNQPFECCQNDTENPILGHEKELAPVSKGTNMEHITAKIRDHFRVDAVQHVNAVKRLILNSNEYISERSLIIINANGTVPVFGLLKNIYVLKDCSLHCFEYQPYETLGWNRDLLAYEVAVPNLAQETQLINAEKLVDHTSYFPISFKNRVYVTTKYILDDVIALKKAY